jgi:tetratricopeptide (TPR) repeat protein
VDTDGPRMRRWERVILAAGPVLGAAVGAITNIITSSWNWWLFLALIALVSLTAAVAVATSSHHQDSSSGARDSKDHRPICTLPPGIAVFVGRQSELRRLSERVDPPRGRPIIYMIVGSPGSGKTELAVQAAYRMASRYPDAQLFLGFRSYSGEGARLDVRDTLINALGTISPDLVHNSLDIDQLSSHWRADTSSRRILVILDDVVEATQVWPLVPNSRQSLVLITSRQLIPGIDADTLIELGGLSPDEARQMISGITRRASQTPDESVILSLARAHHLPLSLRHVADQLVANPEAVMPTSLPEPGELGDPASTFRLSVRSLSDTEQLVFRRAGLYPGTHATAESVGALANLPPADAGEALDVLHQHGLIGRPDSYGYAFHDLVRSLALEESQAHDDQADLAAARQRLFEFTVDTLTGLNALISAPMGTDATRHVDMTFRASDEFSAYEWFESYFEDYRAIARLAISYEWPGTWQLTKGLSYFMRTRRNIPQAIELAEAALQIATIADGDLGMAVTYLQIGVLERAMSNYTSAQGHVDLALPIFKARNDLLGQASCYSELGTISHHLSRYADAREKTSQALLLFEQIGNARGIANSEGVLGMVNRLMGNYSIAREHLSRALARFTEMGNVRNQAWVLIELGTIDRQMGDYTGGRERFTAARDLFDRTGDRSGIAWADRELGIVDRMTGRYASASHLLSAALGTFDAIGSKRNIADAHIELGTLHRETGALRTALLETVTALRIYHEIGNIRGAAWAELQIGTIERMQGDPRAAERFEQAIETYERIADKSGLARAHLELGVIVAGTDPERAREYLNTALALYAGMQSPETAEIRRQLAAL